MTTNAVPASRSPTGVLAQASCWLAPVALRLSNCTRSVTPGACGIADHDGLAGGVAVVVRGRRCIACSASATIPRPPLARWLGRVRRRRRRVLWPADCRVRCRSGRVADSARRRALRSRPGLSDRPCSQGANDCVARPLTAEAQLDRESAQACRRFLKTGSGSGPLFVIGTDPVRRSSTVYRQAACLLVIFMCSCRTSLVSWSSRSSGPLLACG